MLKALEKDRNRRYQSANALASDLRNFLVDQPVTAAPPTWSYQFSKFARRNRVAMGTAAAFALVLLIATMISAWQAIRATRHLNRARLNAYASEMNVAQQAIRENNLERALELLNRQRPRPGEDDLRGFEWRYLWQICQGNESAVFRDAPPQGLDQCTIAFSLGSFLSIPAQARWLFARPRRSK